MFSRQDTTRGSACASRGSAFRGCHAPTDRRLRGRVWFGPVGLDYSSWHRNPGATGSVNRPLLLPRAERSTQMRHQAGSMIADSVRYMSLHSRKQPDSHGHSGTSQSRKLERLDLNIHRNVPGVDGKAVHFNDPHQGVLGGYVGPRELRREMTDPQQVADLPGLAAHRALGHAERLAELVSRDMWLSCRVGHKFAWPSAYTTPAAHVARRPAVSGDGRLRASFATARQARSPYSSSRTARHTASVMATISSAASRSAFGTLSPSRSIMAAPALAAHPQPSAAAALRAAFLAAAGRAHFSADVTTWGFPGRTS